MKDFPDHIKWLIDKKGASLHAALKVANIDITPETAMEIFMAADPSQGKRAVDWITNTFIAQGFLWEDVEAGNQSKVWSTLELFALNRKHLAVEKRNLSQYIRLSHVYEEVKAFAQPEKTEITGKEKKRTEKAEVLGETIVIDRTNECIIAVPLTQKASKWWGKGTQWCTAATQSSNYFDRYNKDGPLIIVLFPNGLPNDPKNKEVGNARKFQLWISGLSCEEGGQFYFMDENNTPVNGEFVRNNWCSFAPIVEWVAEHNSNAQAYFPSSRLDDNKIVQLLKLNSRNLDIIDPKIVSYNAYRTLIENNPEMIRKVPVEMMNRELATIALKNNPQHYIEYIPKKYQDKDSCLKALEYSFYLSETINFDLIGEEDILGLITKTNQFSHRLSSEYKSLLENLTDDLRSSRVIKALISTDKNCFSFLKQREINHENILIALNVNPDLIYKVPINFINNEITQLLAEKSPGLLRVLPSDLINASILDIALEHDDIKYIDWKWIPKKLLTRELCVKITVSNEDFWDNIPKDLIDQNFCTEIYGKNPRVIEYMPPEFTDDLWWKKAIKERYYLLTELPLHLHTEELYLELLDGKENNPVWVSFLPSVLTERVCLAMIDYNPSSLKVIPEQMQTIEMCRQAIDKSRNLMEYVSPRFKTEIEEYFTRDRINVDADSSQHLSEPNSGVDETTNNRLHNRWGDAVQRISNALQEPSTRLWEDSFLNGLAEKLKNAEKLVENDQALTPL